MSNALHPALDERKWSWQMRAEIGSLGVAFLLTFSSFLLLPPRDAFSIILKVLLLMVSGATLLAAFFAYRRYREALPSIARKLSDKTEAWARLTYTRGFFRLRDPPLLLRVVLTRGSGGRGKGPEPYFVADLTFYLPKIAVSYIALRSSWHNGVKIETERSESDKAVADRLVEVAGSLTKALKCDVEVRTKMSRIYDPISRSYKKAEATVTLRRVPLSKLTVAVKTVEDIVRLLRHKA